MRQISFGFLKDYKKEFGGSKLIGKRKSKRPLSLKAPLHLILKADQKGVFSPGNRSLERLIRRTAKKFRVQVDDLAINWSHIHFLIRIRDRQDYVRFVRALTSLLAQAVAHTRGLKGKLFTLRPFSRIVTWGRDLKSILSYLQLNQMEAFGLISRKKGSSKKKENLTKRKSAIKNLLGPHPTTSLR